MELGDLTRWLNKKKRALKYQEPGTLANLAKPSLAGQLHVLIHRQRHWWFGSQVLAELLPAALGYPPTLGAVLPVQNAWACAEA